MAVGVYIISLMVLAAIIFLSLRADYEKIRGELLQKAIELIKECEKQNWAGRAKMEYVVRHLIWETPVFFSGILTQERLQEMAQDAFEKMEDFAYLKYHTVKTADED